MRAPERSVVNLVTRVYDAHALGIVVAVGEIPMGVDDSVPLVLHAKEEDTGQEGGGGEGFRKDAAYI